MSALSDHLLVAAILAYTVAMLAYAAEYAFGSQGFVARVAVRERELVGAGVGDSAGVLLDDPRPISVAPDTGADPGSSRFAPLAGWSAVALTGLGWLAHLGCLVARGLAAHRVPWGNMYEFVLAVTFVGATAWLVMVTRRPSLRPLGLFVTLVLVVLLGIDGMRLYTAVEPLHVTAAVTASGTFLVGFVIAGMALIRMGHDHGYTRFPFSLGDRLPAADRLERLTFRVHAFAFPIWTFAIMCGAIWAEAAWGRYWGWDPKETWSFIAWVIYAGYLHARATPSVKRWAATLLAVIGWAAMMVNLFGVNLVISGLHSYAGVK
jgi:cytochrome c-type biogenesis protein CcsB